MLNFIYFPIKLYYGYYRFRVIKGDLKPIDFILKSKKKRITKKLIIIRKNLGRRSI